MNLVLFGFVQPITELLILCTFRMATKLSFLATITWCFHFSCPPYLDTLILAPRYFIVNNYLTFFKQIFFTMN